MSEFSSLESKVLQWANDKGILNKSTPLNQHKKTQEEVDELLQALKDNDQYEIIDAIGDITVTLIIQSKLNGLNFLDCVQSAYNVISKRTGKMVDGIFVKDVK